MAKKKKNKKGQKKNLFNQAKKKAKKDTPQQQQKEEIGVVELKDKELHEDGKRLVEITEKISALKAEQKSLKQGFYNKSLEEYGKVYDQQKQFPETVNFKLEGDKRKKDHRPIKWMYIPQKRSRKLKEEEAEQLVEDYGEEVVEEKTKYKLNNKLVDKYAEELSELIMSSDKITEEDKEKLIQAEIEYRTPKDLVEKLKVYDGTKKHPAAEVMQDCKVVTQIKSLQEEADIE